MKKHFFVATCSACLGMASIIWGQTPGQVPGQTPPGQIPGQTAPGQTPGQQRPGLPQQTEPDQGEATTLVGCLTKAGAGQYTIADDKTQKRVTFSAPDKIEPFLNQTVQLTGQTVARGGATEFVPQGVKRISDSCTNAPKK